MPNRRCVAALAGLTVGLSVVLTGCGDGARTLKIVSDLPLQGQKSVQSEQMVSAIKYVIAKNLDKEGCLLGRTTTEGPRCLKIAFESMDNSTAADGTWNPGKCVENARSNASDDRVVGVIGPGNSGCAEYEIPILDVARVAMVSPSVTAVGLTRGGRFAAPGQPKKYYPSHYRSPEKRNFFRVIASDRYQGAAGAQFMHELGVKRVYVLHDNDLYGQGLSRAFDIEAGKIPGLRVVNHVPGLRVVNHASWDPHASSYSNLMARIRESGADGIYIGGSSANNGRQLIRDKVACLGGNDTQNGVKVLASESFVSSSLFDGSGAVEGVFGTFPQPVARRTVGLQSSPRRSGPVPSVVTGAHGKVPSVVTGGAMPLSTVTAELAGNVTPNGRPTQPAVYWFEYGRTTGYGRMTGYGTLTAKQKTQAGDKSPVAVSALASGLRAGELYHYRLVAGNASGRANGADGTFSALDNKLEPYVVYAAAAAEVLVDAIRRSDGTRADVIEKLRKTDLPNTFVGPMSFDRYGDPRKTKYALLRATRREWRPEAPKPRVWKKAQSLPWPPCGTERESNALRAVFQEMSDLIGAYELRNGRKLENTIRKIKRHLEAGDKRLFDRELDAFVKEARTSVGKGLTGDLSERVRNRLVVDAEGIKNGSPWPPASR